MPPTKIVVKKGLAKLYVYRGDKRPARASVIAAASPFGPDPTTIASCMRRRYAERR
jgi:hypothetical protein